MGAEMSANSRMTLSVHVLTWIASDLRGTDDGVGTSHRITTGELADAE